eukprot:SAG11_NODE_4827_length_1752_cov_4.010284_2_plen_54_part_00
MQQHLFYFIQNLCTHREIPSALRFGKKVSKTALLHFVKLKHVKKAISTETIIW